MYGEGSVLYSEGSVLYGEGSVLYGEGSVLYGEGSVLYGEGHNSIDRLKGKRSEERKRPTVHPQITVCVQADQLSNRHKLRDYETTLDKFA